jgi:2-phospho-L-lactate guanylyltransferase (CobY/MobA/RfbA family)
LLVSPPDLIEFCFGGDSREAHVGAARAVGARVEVFDGPLTLDIDTPEDLLIAQTETPEVVGG